ncbi:pyridoxal phosphate-dependent aminotransferase [Streptomyces mirabilis]|uniref:pyridoxal phosphate-dependent aminotransferase n=1 Tax=Streptomyces mirabilis TaxID=68239 RepID=UPI0036C6746D
MTNECPRSRGNFNDDFPLGYGDLDMRGDNSPPLAVVEEVLGDLKLQPGDVTGYGPVAGLDSLRSVIAAVFGVDPAQVMITAGGSEALHLAFACVADPGQPINLPAPAFPGFRQLAELGALRPRLYDSLGAAGVEGAVTAPGPTVVCSPHNPTGRLADRCQLRVASTGWLIWDVSHMQLFGAAMNDFRTGLGETEIVVFSLSKLLRLPGARVGCLISGSTELIEAATAVKTHVSMSTSVLSQRLAQAVLEHPQTPAELHERSERLAEIRQQLQQALAESGLAQPVAADDGTHLLCLGADGADPWRRLKAAGIVGLPGSLFDCPAAAVRLCVAQSAETVQAALERITGHGK